MNRKSLPVLLVLIFFLSAVSGCLNDIEEVPLVIGGILGGAH